MKKFKLFIPLIATLSLVGCGSGESSPTDVKGSEISENDLAHRGWKVSELVETGIEGVSPEIIKTDDGKFLLFTSSLSQKRVFSSTDGFNFNQEDLSVPMGSDYSIIKKNDGTYLFYLVGMDMAQPQNNPQPNNPGDPNQPNQPMQPAQPAAQNSGKMGLKKVMVSTSPDLKTFSNPVSTGIEQTESTPAWGVPDTYEDLDGNVRMMWVSMSKSERYEVLETAVSKDGINFIPDNEPVIKDGYVDPYMLQVAENDWVLLLSTTPDQKRLPQKIYLAWSKDGENWDIDPEPILYEEGVNYLDPAAVKINDKQWRLIISTTKSEQALTGPYRYLSTVLTAP